MPRGFFSVENSGEGLTRININGVVGDWGNSSEDVVWHIENSEAKEVEVVIQSPGGSAFEGIAIYSALRNHSAKITTRVLGAAASAGSIIFMAGDDRIMPENTYLMIHEPSLNIRGKAKDLREAADFLDSMTKALHLTYAPYVSISDEKLTEMLMKDTWIRAADAKSMGFANVVSELVEVAALSSSFKSFVNTLPSELEDRPISEKIKNINTVNDLESCLRESGGLSKGLATALVSKAKQILQGEPVDDAEKILKALNGFKFDKI